MISASRVFQPSWLAQAADTQNSHPATPAASVTSPLDQTSDLVGKLSGGQSSSLRPGRMTAGLLGTQHNPCHGP